MRRILSAALVAVMLALPVVAGATNTTRTKLITLPGVGEGASNAGGYFELPTMASGDTCTCIANVQNVIGWTSVSGVMTGTIIYGFTTSVAGDSAEVNLFGGFDATTGTFTAVIDNTLQANTVKGATPYVIKSAVAATSLLPFPFFKIEVIAKAGLDAGTRFWFLSPRDHVTGAR